MSGKPCPYWKNINMNPWGKRIPDCAIRAVSLGLVMRYPFVCKAFGKECKRGYGLYGAEGIDLEMIKKRFGPFFDVIEDAKDTAYENRPPEFEDMEFDPLIDQDEDWGLTLEEFCDLYEGTGRYLVALNTTHLERLLTKEDAKHIVCCDLRPGKKSFADTWDSSWMRVECFMRIEKIWPTSRPESIWYLKNKKK